MNTENINNTAVTEQKYVKPQIDVIEIENEGILAASSGSMDDGGGYWAPGW